MFCAFVQVGGIAESPWVFGDASRLHDLKRLSLFRRDEVPARNTNRQSGFAFTHRKKFLRVPRGVFQKRALGRVKEESHKEKNQKRPQKKLKGVFDLPRNFRGFKSRVRGKVNFVVRETGPQRNSDPRTDGFSTGGKAGIGFGGVSPTAKQVDFNFRFGTRGANQHFATGIRGKGKHIRGRQAGGFDTLTAFSECFFPADHTVRTDR